MIFKIRLGMSALALLVLPLMSNLATAGPLPASAIPGYEQDRWVVSGSLGMGLASTYGTGGMPLIAGTAELGVTPRVSVGGSAGVASSKYDAYGYNVKYSYTVVAARASYHFVTVVPQKPVDLYAGLSLGYNHVGVSTTGVDAYDYGIGTSYVLYGLYGGARWYVNPKVAVFGEVGYGLGQLAIGTSVRL